MNLTEPTTAVIPSLEGAVLRVLARTTAPLTGGAVAGLVPGASAAGVRKALQRLVRQGTVLGTRVGPSTTYLVNRDHLAWPAIREALHLTARLRAVLYEHLDSLLGDILTSRYDGVLAGRVSLLVFGSVARGESTADSDVDLLAVVPDDIAEQVLDDLVDETSRAVHRWTGNRANLMVITSTRLQEMVIAADPLVRSWSSDAQLLHGPVLRLRTSQD